MSPPSSGSKNNPSKKRVPSSARFMLASCMAYSSTVEMETCFSETSVDFHRSAVRYIPEDQVFATTDVKTTIPASFILHVRSACFTRTLEDTNVRFHQHAN
jgi:hypothetical protein